ncbi:hypothetical protein ABMA27_002125 [Loxostege sticticalis]|uniref:PHD-type domain-containing protein n=1 Tax=Loxostege sticticalis TaxID=481309 RepID=A0ABR3HWN6_LOXSC
MDQINKEVNGKQMICSGCHQEVDRRQYLKCCLCDQIYDLLCANVPEKRFYNTMDKDRKKSWRCPCCLCKQPKTNNINSPVGPAEDPQNANITLRKRHLKLTIEDESFHEDVETSMDENLINEKSLLGDTINSHIQPSHQDPPRVPTLTLEQISTLLDKKLERNENKIVELLKNEIRTLIQKEIQDSMSKLNSEVTQRLESVTNRHDQLSSEIEHLRKTINTMKEEIEHLQTKFNSTTYKNDSTCTDNSKKIVFYGLDEHKWESKDQLHDRVINIICDYTNINLHGYVEGVTRLGRKGYRRPIVLELMSKKMTKLVLNSKRAFVRSGMAVTEFLDNDSLQKHNELRKLLYKARKEGHHAIIRNHKLIIDGQDYNNGLSNTLDVNTHNTRNNDTIQQSSTDIKSSRSKEEPPPPTSTNNRNETIKRSNHSFRR